MIIVLMGYMASGKSVIGKKLSQMLNYNFIDLDNFIEEEEGASISKLFETKGEIYFRKKETVHLLNVLKNSDNLVLALGGGTPCYSQNIKILLENNNCTTVYLRASVNVLAERLQNETTQRPLIAHINFREDLMEFIGKHLFERMPYYDQAELTIATDDKTINEVVSTIVLNLF